MTSAVNTENWHTGYNEFMKQWFGWIAPYFIARFCFRSEVFRRRFLWVLIISILVLAPVMLIEARLWPHSYVKWAAHAGLKVRDDAMTLGRLGLFRAQVSFGHPIFFGDACLSVGVLILMLAATTSVGVRKFWVLAGAGSAAFGVLTSFSFGPWGGSAIACGVFFMLYFVKFSRPLLPIMVLVAIGVLVAITYHLATAPMPPRPQKGTMADSFYIRRLIVQNCWKLVTTAGWFGHGRLIDQKDLDLESVDNAYILFAMCRGWLYCGLWLALPVCVAMRVSKAMRRFRASSVHIFPLAVGAGGALGISAAYYGVWAGWSGEPYTMLWLIGIALTMTICDFCLEAASQPLPQQVAPVAPPPARVMVPA
jgi:hypothetical protein